MQTSRHPLSQFAIFRESQLMERGEGDARTAKARLEHFSNTTPDHNWRFVVYNAHERHGEKLSTPASRSIH